MSGLEVTFAKCGECGVEQLSFALKDRRCFWCDGTLVAVEGVLREISP